MARMFLSFLSMPGLKSREYGSTPPAIYSIGWLDTKNDQNLLGHFSGVGTSNRMDDDCCFFFFQKQYSNVFGFGNSQQFSIPGSAQHTLAWVEISE